MHSDKEHLNVDLAFLDEARPREAEALAASKYKVNWRNIAIIGGLIVVVFIWIGLSDNTSSQRATPTSYARPATTVSNGQFSCSSYASNQADLMQPKNELELNQEEEELKHRSDALDSLKIQIDASGVTHIRLNRRLAATMRWSRSITHN